MPSTTTPRRRTPAGSGRRRSPQLTASTESSDTTPHSPVTATSGSLYGGPASSYLSGSASTEGPYEYSNDDYEDDPEDEEMDDAETAAGRNEDEEGMVVEDGEDPLCHATDEQVRQAALNSLGIDPDTNQLRPIRHPFPSDEYDDDDEEEEGHVPTDAERLRALWSGAGKGDIIIPPAGEGQEREEDVGLLAMLEEVPGLFQVPVGATAKADLQDRVFANLCRIVKDLEDDEWMHRPAPAFNPPKLAASIDAAPLSLPVPTNSLSSAMLDAHLAVAFNPLALPSRPPISTSDDAETTFLASRHPWVGQDGDDHTEADVSLRELLTPVPPPLEPHPFEGATRPHASAPPQASRAGTASRGASNAVPVRRSPRRTSEVRRSALAREVSRLDMGPR